MSEVVMDIQKIMEYLPHRYPFLLVDRIIEIGDKKIVGIKNVTRNENFFNGHFPQMPIMPGVLQVEALAQTAGLYMLSSGEHKGKIGLFISIENARFKRMVIPGDTLRLEIEILKMGKIMTCKGIATVEGETACEAGMKFILAPAQKNKE